MSGRADAVTINTASCVAQPDNVLRFDCSVETDTTASVDIRFCDATVGGSGCSKTRIRAAGAGVASTSCTVGSACTLYDLTVYNLISGHDYEWQAHAADATSSDVWTAPAPDDVFTPAALPSPGLAGIDLSIEVSGTSAMQDVLFNYGCTTSEIGASQNGYVIIADTDGNIVWYQDPRIDTGHTDAVIGGLHLTRPDKHILLLDSKDTLLEYDLEGTTLQMLQRDAGDFDDTDGVSRFVHHDLKREGDYTYVITAREYAYVDGSNCDGDATTTTLTYILDGVMVFDHTTDPWTPVPSLEWSLSDIYDPSDCTGPQPPTCTSTLWSSEGMTGCDWAHTNSIWTDSDGTWLLSFKDQDKLIEVDEATGALVWELYGDGVSGDLLLNTEASIADPEFDNQHHAWRTATPNHIMLYDNNVTGPADPRALELELSPAAGVYAVVAEWPTPPLEPRGDCDSKGSAFDMLPSGHVLATCAPSGIIREFEPAGAEVWKLTLSCPDTMMEPSGNLYRAMPFNFGP